jgi:hypothetical protein
MELNIAFRKAVLADFKKDRNHLNIGQTYAISKDNNKTVNGIFSIKGDEDPFILKYYLENERILIPENCPLFADWIEDNKDF